MSFENPDTSFENETGAPPVLVVAPASGATVVARSSVRFIYVNPPAGVAALTVALPRNPEPNQFLELGFGQAVTALTVLDGNGNAIPNMPATGAANAAIRFVFIKPPAQVGFWVKWR